MLPVSYLLLTFLGTLLSPAWADTLPIGNIAAPHVSVRLPSTLQFGFEQLSLPANEKMGVLGTSYLMEVTPGIQIGPAVYGSVTGKRGGFFTIGAEAAWRQPIVANLEFQTGLYAGGGGGGPSTVGGGLMLRPHLELLWNISGLRAGISASRVQFPSGAVHSNQLGLVFSSHGDFIYTPAEYIGTTTAIQDRQGLGFDRAIAVAGAYRPSRGAVSNTIGYAGVRLERFCNPHLYWGIEAAGAASGNASGYAELLGTLGAETPVIDDVFSVGIRIAAGMGGGSAALIQVGGGQLDKIGLYATGHLSRNAHFSLEGGYAAAPGGQFRASYGSAGLVFDLDHAYAPKSVAKVAGNEWVVGAEHYFSVRHKNGGIDTLNALSLKQNYYLNDSVYITGQARSAYGGYSGGYAVGLIGLGYRTPKTHSGFYVGTDMLVGAAGGGLVDTSGGAVIQPMVYLGMDVSKGIGIKLSAGRIKSLKGGLDSNLADLAINLKFGTAGR
jgi:hypothetical protein